ncbi:MAG: H-NS histone family protein [Bradyrhizobium sp.]|nr:H-NS histone family protein [Bradyrhizobium sp.]
MKEADIGNMTVDDLWALREKLSDKLEARILAEQEVLEHRLDALRNPSERKHQARKPERRPYPTVFPKFFNPEDPTQTWAGRGKQPRWLASQLRAGRRVDDFRIQPAAQ